MSGSITATKIVPRGQLMADKMSPIYLLIFGKTEICPGFNPKI